MDLLFQICLVAHLLALMVAGGSVVALPIVGRELAGAGPEVGKRFGPATYVASVREADALLLETPFLSAVNVAFERYPYLPVGLLMDDQFPVNEWITKVEEPVFIAHGTADQTIGVTNGERLYQIVPHKYDLWIEPGADHGDLWARGIWSKAKTFFEDAEYAAAKPAA